MAIVIITTDDHRELHREDVHPLHLENEASSLQVFERVAWAVNEADGEPCYGVNPLQSYLHVGAG